MAAESPLRHPYCSGEHPTREARVGPYDFGQCRLCWLALNEPERVAALRENRPHAENAAAPVGPVKPARWPWCWRLLALLRTKADRGVGDTVARLLGYVGGERLKRWHRRLTKKDCGCQGRQGRLNRLYPY